MDKRTFNIIVGILVTLVILLVVTMTLLISNKQQPEGNLGSEQPSLLPDSSEQLPGSTTSPPQVASSPEQVAKAFYDWYVSHPNPLGTKAYLNSPHISAGYKESIQGFVIRGDYLDSDPILTCVNVKPPEIIMAQTAVYDTTRLKASVNLQENVVGGRALYEVLLGNINGRWLIDDVRCSL